MAGGVTVRLFAGSAGWASGQLEDELAEGAWWLMDAAPEDPLTSQPDELWAQVLRRPDDELIGRAERSVLVPRRTFRSGLR